MFSEEDFRRAGYRYLPIPIELTLADVWAAATGGIMRRLNALKHRRVEIYRDGSIAAWNEDINGAIAEYSAAKYYKMFWDHTVGKIDMPDVGWLQVRSKLEIHFGLCITSKDADDQAYISVLVGIPTCYLCGWMQAREARQRQEWFRPANGKPGRWFVPPEALRPMHELTASQPLPDLFTRSIRAPI